MSTKNSSCEYFLPLLDAFVDKELEATELSEVEAHLVSCEECRNSIKEIELLKTTLAAMPKLTLSRDLADDLDRLLHAGTVNEIAPKDNVIPLRKRNSFTVAFAAAAALAVVLIAGRAITTTPSPQVANSNHPASQPSVTALQTKLATKPAPAPVVKTVVEKQAPVVAQQIHKSVSAPVQATSSGNNLVAHENSQTEIVNASENRINKSASNEIIALYDDDDTAGTDIGMTTDEDGLYALRL